MNTKVTNTSVFDKYYYEALFGGMEFPDGTFAIDCWKEFSKFQKWYMETLSDIHSENMFTYPVNTISLLVKKGDFPLDTLDRFSDKETAETMLKHNMKWSDSNIFADTSVNSLSNCCRLKSNIKDLGFMNSIGGTALRVGSVKVNTINLARVALDSKNQDEFLELLYERTLLSLKALDRVRHIIRRNVEKGLLPNFSKGLVSFDSLYNTTGIIGNYEVMKHFGFIEEDKQGNISYTEEAYALGEKLFDTIRKAHSDFTAADDEIDYQINIEQIPK